MVCLAAGEYHVYHQTKMLNKWLCIQNIISIHVHN